jgi:hypothetical protein
VHLLRAQGSRLPLQVGLAASVHLVLVGYRSKREASAIDGVADDSQSLSLESWTVAHFLADIHWMHRSHETTVVSSTGKLLAAATRYTTAVNGEC